MVKHKLFTQIISVWLNHKMLLYAMGGYGIMGNWVLQSSYIATIWFSIKRLSDTVILGKIYVHDWVNYLQSTTAAEKLCSSLV